MEDRNINSISQVRNLSLEIIYRVNEHKAYTNITLEKYLRNSQLSQIDKKLVTEIVNGTTRMIKHLDWVLNLFLKNDMKKLHPLIRNLLRISLYQILFMDKVPNYAVVNDAVELARKKTNHNLSKLVNGVLRNVIRNLDNIKYPAPGTSQYLSIYYSHPQWLIEKFLGIFNYPDLEEILLYNNTRPKLHLRVNRLKTNREDLLEKLLEENINCAPSKLFPMAIEIKRLNLGITALKTYQDGYFYIQNIASMLAALILAPKPYDFIYDLCSGVGGKATHLAELMDNQGDIHCYDVYAKKLNILNNNAKRLGISIITTHLEDVLNIKPLKLADAVLLDAPCSGLGVLNRRSDLRWNISPEKLIELNQLQSSLLYKASQLVKVEGRILYATCSINPNENEGVINNFLKKHNNFELIGFEDKIPDFLFDEKDRLAASQGMLTIIPGKYQTDGMFYALLKRKDAG